jgi:pimeloyl-ACP methyl ester carboxylesterase
MRDLSILLDSASASERRLHRVEVREVRGRAAYLAVEEIGRASSAHVVVMIHGALSDRGAWRYLPGELVDDTDLWLVDLLGCGDSSKPSPDDDDAVYSLDAHAHDVWTALRTLSADREPPPRMTLVGHSLGTAVVLRMLGDDELREEFDDVRGRVQGTVLFAPLDVAMHRVDPMFEKIATVTEIEIRLGDVTGLLDLQIERATREGWVESDRVPWEESQRLLDILTDRTRRQAAQATILRAVPFGDDGRPAWRRIEAMVDDYRNVDVPCLLIAGARDETLPPAMAYKLTAQIRDARLVIVERAMHSIPLEHPRLAADLVRSFVEDPHRQDERMVSLAPRSRG